MGVLRSLYNIFPAFQRQSIFLSDYEKEIVIYEKRRRKISAILFLDSKDGREQKVALRERERFSGAVHM